MRGEFISVIAGVAAWPIGARTIDEAISVPSSWRRILVHHYGDSGGLAARELGLDVPPTLVARADEVIE